MSGGQFTTSFWILSLLHCLQDVLFPTFQPFETPFIFTCIEGSKFTLALLFSIAYRGHSRWARKLPNASEDSSSTTSGSSPSADPFTLGSCLSLGLLGVCQSYISMFLLSVTDQQTFFIFESLTLISTTLLWTRTYSAYAPSSTQRLAMCTQVVGVVVLEVKHCMSNTHYSWFIYMMLFSFTLIKSAISCHVAGMANASSQPQRGKLMLFGFGFILHGLAMRMNEQYQFITFASDHYQSMSGSVMLFIALHSLIGLLGFLVLQRTGPVVEGMTYTTGIAMTVLFHIALGERVTGADGLGSDFASAFPVISACGTVVVACALALYALDASKIDSGQATLPISKKSALIEKDIGLRDRSVKKSYMLMGLCLLFWVQLVFLHRSNAPSTLLHRIQPKLRTGGLRRISSPPPLKSKDFKLSPGANASTWQTKPDSPALAAKKQDIRDHFSDVLLIVHWNTLRYDTNVDAFKFVYGDYFPNIVNYGPEEWDRSEDKNFARMADIHAYGDFRQFRQPGALGYLSHYLAMKQYPGYRGYLWVNFDVYLNVSSLQHFDKDKVWGPGPICEWDAVAFDEPCKHNWHWWCTDMGLTVCKKAINTIHEKSEEWTGQKAAPLARCASAPSDAFYVPASKSHMFLPYAETFLENEVFLEMAIPAMTSLMNTPDAPVHEWIMHFQGGVDLFPERLTTEFQNGTRWVCHKENRTSMDMGHPMHWKPKDQGGQIDNAPIQWRDFIANEL